MKKKNFLMLALAAVAFAACSNEDLVPVDNPGNNNDLVTDPNADAWVALAVKTPVQTRGLHNPNQEAASADESKISEVRAIFFTAANDENDATVTADITLSNEQAGLDANGIPSGAGKAFKVPATSKRILIIANPSVEFAAKTFSTTTKYSEVNAALDDAVSTMTTAGKFMMSNAKGSLEPSDEDETSGTFGDPIDLSLYANETAATNNALSIRIDRVVAKVRVYVTSDSDAKATISDAGWVLNATNKTYFPVSKRTLTWNETETNKTLGARGECVTPFDQYKIGSYRIDPNYGSQNLSDYNSYSSTSAPLNWNDPTTTINKIAEYCLENTQTAAHNVHAYTTHVLLKAKFIPSEYGRPAPNHNDPSKVQEADPKLAGDWMLINGGFYTFATLMEWIEAELNAKYADGEPTTYPTVRTTAYNRYLAAVGVGAIDLPATADATAITDLVDAFKATKAAVANVAAKDRAITVTGLTYYVDAVSYYKIMIKHDDTSAATNELGEFGVVRNSVYDINVKKFNNPGYPAIPDPDPNTPDESDEGWLSIEIIPNPWTWYTQEEIM